MKSEKFQKGNQREEFMSLQREIHHLLTVKLHIGIHCRFTYLVLLKKKSSNFVNVLTSFLLKNKRIFEDEILVLLNALVQAL